jgi:hypothetical protein
MTLYFPVSEPVSTLPDVTHAPYYIVTPPYIRTSAGIRGMHLLVHWLNRAGYQAFVYVPPDQARNATALTNPYLLTPLLDQAVVDFHFRSERKPIVVCSDSFRGTLTNAPFTVRWYGHYSGALTDLGDAEVSDLKYGYSRRIARSLGVPDNVLCLPVTDTNTFRLGEPAERGGTCYYAAKYKSVFGGRVFGLPEGSVEITRDLPDSQRPDEIAKLFQTSRYFYCFEDSALILEAILCGCPVILMKSRYFTNPLGVEDFSWDGIAWGDEPEEVARAERTVGKAGENYAGAVRKFFEELGTFVAATQTAALERTYSKPIELPAGGAGQEPPAFRFMSASDVEQQLAETQRLLRMMHNSTSWRVTAPLRRLITQVRNLRRTRGRGDAGP